MFAAATAASALAMGFEMYFEHYRGSFSSKWMWAPVLTSPLLAAAGAAAVRSERAAHTVLPAAAAVYAAEGAVGSYLHLRGIHRRPGGFHEPVYNLAMGPPALAPGALAAIGALGLAAPIFARS